MDIINQEDQLMLRIQKSFFLLEPLDSLLVDLICLNKDFDQKKLLLCTIHHNIIKKYPNKLDYTLRYLKQLISLLEYNGIEVLDTIYNEYVTFMSVKAEDKEYYYRHFVVNENICIIKNTYSMISRGTTGLCVWEGALVLAEWCLQNQTFLENKIVLELGCGVGMAGLVAIKNCKVKSYIFSDCNDDVLKILKHNIQISMEESGRLYSFFSDLKDTKAEASEVNDVLCEIISKVSQVNIKSDSDSVYNSVELGNPKESHSNPTIENMDDEMGTLKNPLISIRNLSFEELSLLKKNELICDVVLASDIVYDTDLFPSLVEALVNIFKLNKNCMAIFACKVRNIDTFDSFIKILKKTEMFEVSDEQLSPNHLFFFSDQKMYSMVKLLAIKRSHIQYN